MLLSFLMSITGNANPKIRLNVFHDLNFSSDGRRNKTHGVRAEVIDHIVYFWIGLLHHDTHQVFVLSLLGIVEESAESGFAEALDGIEIQVVQVVQPDLLIAFRVLKFLHSVYKALVGIIAVVFFLRCPVFIQGLFQGKLSLATPV